MTFEYDLAGRVTKQSLPDARFIRYDYDENGNLKSLTPPGRSAHVFEYTTNDLEAKYTPPDLGVGTTVTRYAYNLDKDLDLITRPDGQTVDFEYNAPGKKLSAIIVPNGTYTSSYEPSTGQLDVLTAPGGQALTYTYDGFLLKSETATGDVAGTVGWNYNNDFWVTSQAVNGNGISFGYDNDGLLTAAGAESIVRNPAHGLIDSTTLGSVTSSHGYNTFGELTSESVSYSGSALYQASYSVRDKLGRIKEKTETVQGETHAYVYAYDLAGRLDTVTRDGLLVSDYGYNENGNRLSHNATAASYDAQDRLLTYGTASYTYTPNGELLTRTESGVTTTYGYDVLGNLRSVTLPDDITLDYVIDGRNRRVGKRVNGALVQGFLYGNQLEPVAELDGAGTVVARFVYASKLHVPDHMIKGGLTYRIISDQVGSPRLVINTADGSIAQRMDHDEFGNVTIDTNPGFQPFGFAGGIYDQHTKLTRFGARDYDAETGRWTAKDPVRFDAAGSNLYGYSGDDPVNFIDLRGENPVGAAIALAADVAFQLSRPGTGVCDIDLIEAGVAAATGALFPGAGTALAEYAGVGAVSSEAIGGIIAGGTIRGSYNRAPENDGPYGRLTLPIGSLLPGVCDDPRDEEPDDGGC